MFPNEGNIIASRDTVTQHVTSRHDNLTKVSEQARNFQSLARFNCFWLICILIMKYYFSLAISLSMKSKQFQNWPNISKLNFLQVHLWHKFQNYLLSLAILAELLFPVLRQNVRQAFLYKRYVSWRFIDFYAAHFITWIVLSTGTCVKYLFHCPIIK